ncbi:hypothetical protein C1J03_11275 [Sulfitobacter sp. SK012]|uniref:PA14 domain-containing protein n=1 Tax=Sulfitobacter sp. SK012 TaxID=1389005 RepID=UPI000E0C88E1|nr:PA14 domain-containing protein [Sulfitobacter sp. SK012]AXI46546.1 hypothetical protein C1J03_11275 [Sulfitobacter sp. SK012]
MKFTSTLIALAFAVPAWAEPLTLTPADPQPDAGDLTPGLAVAYAYPKSPKTLEDAADALKKSRPGPAIKGMSYDTPEGELVMTSRKGTKVAASITGFLRFDAAGTFTVDVISNDGVQTFLGGQEIAFYDGVHACEPAGEQEVIVPEAGWYAIETTYFQRKGSACLMMDWNVSGEMGLVPDEAFAHTE